MLKLHAGGANLENLDAARTQRREATTIAEQQAADKAFEDAKEELHSLAVFVKFSKDSMYIGDGEMYVFDPNGSGSLFTSFDYLGGHFESLVAEVCLCVSLSVFHCINLSL